MVQLNLCIKTSVPVTKQQTSQMEITCFIFLVSICVTCEIAGEVFISSYITLRYILTLRYSISIFHSPPYKKKWLVVIFLRFSQITFSFINFVLEGLKKL